MLKERIVTAILIVVPLLFAFIYLPAVPLIALFAVLLSLAAWEWGNMAGMGGVPARLAYCAVCVVVMALSAWYTQLFSAVDESAVAEVLHVACLWWALALLWVKYYPASARLWGSVAARALIGLLVLVPTWLAISYLRLLPQGIGLILTVILLVAAADVGAYFSGRRWGVAKLAPAVSPGKSWAGFWGGIACVLLVSTVLWFSWPGGMALELPAMLALATVTALASVLGDLLESMIKRHRGIKDSSNLLPGHGGVMDRLDSLSAAIPVFTLGWILVGR